MLKPDVPFLRPRSAVLAGVVLAATAAPAAAVGRPPAGVGTAPKAYLDVRTGTTPGAATRDPASARTRAARSDLRRSLGQQGVIEVDPRTGTPRMLMRRGGALTAASAADRATIARSFVRSNATALGLDAADVAALGTPKTVSAPGGLTVVRLPQVSDGIPSFDGSVTVGLDRAGRILTVGGSPTHDLRASTDDPTLTATDAQRAVARSVGATLVRPVASADPGVRRQTRFEGGDLARLVLFDLGDGHAARLAWHATYRVVGGDTYAAVVDATTGRLLHRADLTRHEAAASVYERYPGAALGGTAKTVDLEANDWLPAGATTLKGQNAHAYSDVDASDTASAGEEVTRDAQGFVRPLTTFSNADAFAGGVRCTGALVCTWNSSDPTSWVKNREQTTVQEFWFTNAYHDALEQPPIGFDKASGNFETEDPVLAESDDGAATDAAGTGPTEDFLDNANMATPPDGQSPRMQMYLGAYDDRPYFDPEIGDYSGNIRDVAFSDDAAIVYHEYTHGLTSRLVTDADGGQALDAHQAGSMGEAWSDWYAFDHLADQGLVSDTAAPGEINLDAYAAAIPGALRSQPLDCPVGTTDVACPGSAGAGPGGYTYGDLGKILAVLGPDGQPVEIPEVHADGEIWGETLWDLRTALQQTLGAGPGSTAAKALVTGALRLSPPQPSMLDERNAIIQADVALYGGDHVALLWKTFAARGMGYFASTAGSVDVTPVEDFSLPPAADGPKGTLKGRVTDVDSGLPLPGARIAFGGLASGTSGQPIAAATGADGAYEAPGIPEHTYPRVSVDAPGGYLADALSTVPIVGGSTTVRDATLRRTWAFGSKATAIDDPGAAYGCGVDGLADADQSSVWDSPAPPVGGPYPTATLELPAPIDVTTYAIDPGEGCTSSPAAQLKDYTLESSTDGVTWTVVRAGSFTREDAHRLNEIPPAGDGRGVRFVRLTAKSAQNPANGFLDVAELAVFGGPRNVLPSGPLRATPGTVAPGADVAFDASGITDPDSAITGYRWDFDGDGTTDRTTSTPTTTFAYAKAGDVTPKVQVDDFRGGAGSATTTVRVVAPTATTTTGAAPATTTTGTTPAPSPGSGAVPTTPKPTVVVGKVSLAAPVGRSSGRRITVRATVSGPGTIAAVATTSDPSRASSRASTSLAPGRGRLTFAKARSSKASKAGRVTLTLVRTAKGRRARYRGRVVTAELKVRFTPTGGRPVLQTRRFRLRVR